MPQPRVRSQADELKDEWGRSLQHRIGVRIGIWAIVIGGGEFGMAFGVEGTAGNRFLLGLTGVLSVALGAVLLVHPDEGAVALAKVFGLFSLAYGITSLILSFQVRDLEPRRTATRPTPTPTSTKP